MHLTDLHVDRFGLWRDLTLPLSGPGLNVLYGPNEAGKSTLMRFAKAVLYGGQIPTDADDGPPNRTIASGTLRFVHSGQPYAVRRSFLADGRSFAQLLGPNDVPQPADKLAELLGHTSEEVFDRLFAVDLYELQELGSLDRSEVAQHLYGASVGPAGRHLIAEVDRLRESRQTLLSHDGRSGRLMRLLERHAALAERLSDHSDRPHRHAEFSGRRAELEHEIEDLRGRRGHLQSEARGRRHLDRVWPAWRQVRTYERDLAAAPAQAHLPADGLEQLDAIEVERGQFTRRRDEQAARAADREAKAERLGPESELLRYEPAIRAMLGLRPWLSETQQSEKRVAQELRLAIAAAGAEPPSTSQLARAVNKVPIRAADQERLTAAATAFRTAQARRSVLQRSYKRLQHRSAKHEAALQPYVAALNGRPADAVADEARRRIETAPKLLELSVKESVLGTGGARLRKRLEDLGNNFDVPPWVTMVLALFAVGGAVFAILGLISGVTTSLLVGAIYLLLGLTCGSLAVKLRAHFENAFHETGEAIRDQKRAEEVELRRIRDELARLGQEPVSTKDRPAIDPLEMVHAEVDRLRIASKVESSQRTIASRRKKLTQLRLRLRTAQQELDAVRQNWCKTLQSLGLEETLDVDAALGAWQRMAGMAATAAVPAPPNLVEPLRREQGFHARTIDQFGGVLADMHRKLQFRGPSQGPNDMLATWERELDAALVVEAERRKLLAEAEQARGHAADCEQRLRELARQKTALLAAAGVRSREEYEHRLQAAAHRREVEDLLDLARAELQDIAEKEPELAIAEEDLARFRPEENAAALNKLAAEQRDVEATLERRCEERGQLQQRLSELEEDDEPAVLRGQLARLDDQIRETFARTLAASAAAEAAEQARHAFERNHQSPVLEASSGVMGRMTRGRYRRIWAPLADRSLRVEDAAGRTFQAEQLSGGTREQLFLALRLALVTQASSRGVRLPVILDDVFVNFDEERTEAAFDALRDMAAQGHQILFFTCHQHLTRLAEKHGIAPIRLPTGQKSLPHRIAG